MTAITEGNRQRYTSLITSAANKIEMCSVVEKMYNVKVSNVSTCRYDGKRSSHHTEPGVTTGHKPASKKAFITLQGEDTTDFSNNI